MVLLPVSRRCSLYQFRKHAHGYCVLDLSYSPKELSSFPAEHGDPCLKAFCRCIKTKGNKRAIVNIDTLSENFEDGARVDINVLKERGIIPPDSGSYKVLARGILDKPLVIYANDFSISAVKMIALTGGEVYRVSKRYFRRKK